MEAPSDGEVTQAKGSNRSRGSRSKLANVATQIAKLEEQLRVRQQQLVQETARNRLVRAQIELLNTFDLSRDTVVQLLAADDAGEDLSSPHCRAIIDKFEDQLYALKHTFDRGTDGVVGGPSRRGAAASKPAPSTSGAGSQLSVAHSTTSPPDAAVLSGGPLGGPGVLTAGQFLRGALAMRRVERSKEEFMSFWRQHVMELAMLLHQECGGGRRMSARFEQVVLAMGVRSAALFLFDPFAVEVIMTDFETGEVCEAPASMWERVAACIELSSDQAVMYGLFNRWWRTTNEALQLQRQTLAQRALEHPDNLEVQEEVALGLERVNSAYLVATAGTLVVGAVALLRPEQVAESWVSSWPRIPLLTAILDAWVKINNVRS
ncbi:hypothetical protein Rsub_12075 [Raphidocelis subcapitata]|uniref:Uncharacterized protein n=1 Tax=Raphidocelis subcapitata TaxID=307507 RepID=A0A2V0PIH9_9CHLO|nr:hypothetical protein Rsub_12075 [Raphidocelis subcapitata]|eukprot:GBF99611.1 hypothetical protein Rsub_12075 [Raphidocelis subcapitata]